MENLEWCGEPMVKKCHVTYLFDMIMSSDIFSHVDTIPACDGRTDGHLATALSALCNASRDKNDHVRETVV